MCNLTPEYSNILWYPTKIDGPKLFLSTKIKPEYSDILYNLTHYPGPLVCRIRQVLTYCTIRHITLVYWCARQVPLYKVVILIFFFDLTKLYCQYQQSYSGTGNYRSVWHQTHVITNKMNCELMLTYYIPAYMFDVYKNQQSRQTGSKNLTGPKTLPTIWHTYMKFVTKYQISAINSCWEKCDEKCAYTNVC